MSPNFNTFDTNCADIGRKKENSAQWLNSSGGWREWRPISTALQGMMKQQVKLQTQKHSKKRQKQNSTNDDGHLNKGKHVFRLG